MAAIAGPKMADEAPISTCAARIVGNVGRSTIATAPIATATAAAAIASRLCRVRSMNAPAGVCAATDAIPIADIAIPIRPGSQCRIVR